METRVGERARIIEGTVVRGKRLGRTLGYPTANIRPLAVEGEWLKNGVYACAMWIEGDDLAWPGMLNQGLHPTAPEGEPTVEVHLIGFSGDIYDRRVRVEYLRFLRPERRFDSLEGLSVQLALDRQAVLDWIEGARADSRQDDARVRARRIRWHQPQPR